MKRGRKPKPASERFWRFVKKTSSCWLWTGAKAAHGYGQFGQVRAHRFSYFLQYGQIPGEREIHHTCSRKDCVNPEHMEVVSREEHLSNHGKHSGDQALRTTAGFRVRGDVYERMKREARGFGYTNLSDMLRTAYKELKGRHTTEGIPA